MSTFTMIDVLATTGYMDTRYLLDLPRQAETERCDFSIFPGRDDGQRALFLRNLGPFKNGARPIRPFLLPAESQCLELCLNWPIIGGFDGSKAKIEYISYRTELTLFDDMTGFERSFEQLMSDIQLVTFEWLLSLRDDPRLLPVDPLKKGRFDILANVCIPQLDFYLPNAKNSAADPFCCPRFAIACPDKEAMEKCNTIGHQAFPGHKLLPFMHISPPSK